MGEKVTKKPKFFNVNWFRTDEEGHFLWPGFGDNLRVLDWILRRTEGKADAVETPIGYVPRPEDIDLSGLDMTTQDVADLLTVDKELWKEDAENIEGFYAKFGDKLPIRRQAAQGARGRTRDLEEEPRMIAFLSVRAESADGGESGAPPCAAPFRRSGERENSDGDVEFSFCPPQDGGRQAI